MHRRAQIRRRALLGGTAALLAAGSARAQAPGTVTFIGWSHDEAASRPVLWPIQGRTSWSPWISKQRVRLNNKAMS